MSNVVQPQDPRVQAALADYLDRLDRGEQVDPQAFLAQHAEIADALRSFLATSEELRRMIGRRTRIELPSEAASRRTGESGPVAEQSTHSVMQADHQTVAPHNRSAGTQSGAQLSERFGRYHILKLLGSGAMGMVYLAEDTHLDRQVALKIPNFERDETGELLERFHREARAAAKLRHTNICPVYDSGAIDGRHFISMAYIEGEPLSSRIKPEKPFSEKQALVIARKLALALQEAHDHGVIHRDLKPGNIMVDGKAEPIITDFGLARSARHEGQARLTQSGMIVGSPAYMSPEQVEADPDRITPATDQYSLGVILFEMLTGALPFSGSITAIIGAILTREPPRPSDLRPGLDPRLETLCLKMMAKSPGDRFPNLKAAAAEMAVVFKALPAGSGGAAKDAPPSATRASKAPVPVSMLAVSQPPAPNATDSTTESGQIALAGAAKKCLARHDYEQVVQMLEQVPERRRTDEVAALLAKARELADEVMFLLTEIDEALRLNDGETAVRKAEALQKLKPGHHKLKEVQEQCGYGKGKRYRTAGRKSAGRIVGEGTWIPWSVLAFGLCVFGVMFWAATLYFRSGDAVVKVTIHDPDVKVSIQGRTLNIESARDAVKVNPGQGTLKITYGDAEFETSKFTLKRGQNPAVDVVLLDDKLAAKFGDQLLGEWSVDRTKVEPAPAGAPSQPASAVLTSPDWEWTEPENLGPGVNTSEREISPAVTSDEKLLVFVRSGDIWESRRKSIDEPFGAAVKLGPPVSRPNSSQTGVAISGDGLLLIVASNRGPGTDEDVYLAERKSVDEPFGKVVLLASPVSSGLADRHPLLSPDGLTLMISSDRKGGHGSADLHRFTRASRSEPFGGEENLGPVVNTPKYDFGGAITSDGLVLFRSTFEKPPSKARDEEDLGTSVMCLRRSAREPFESTQPFGPAFEKFPPFHAVPSPDGRRIYFMSRRPGGFGKADLWMARRVERARDADQAPSAPAAPVIASLTSFAQIPSDFVFATAVSPDGNLVAGGNLKLTRIWNADGTTLVDLKLEKPMAPRTLAFTPDGKHLAWGGWDNGEIRLYDVRTGEKVRTFEGNTGFVTSLCFSTDGRQLLSGSQGRLFGPGFQFAFGPNTRVWNVETGQQLRMFDGEDVSVGGWWLADGRRAVSRNGLSSDDTGFLVRLWDTETGKEEKVFARDLPGVWSVALSSHRKYVAANLKNGVILIWDVDSGKQLQRLEPASNAAFTPDGERVLGSSSKGASLRLWDVKTGRELMRVEEKLPDGVGAIHVFPRGARALVSTYQSGHIFTIPLGEDRPEKPAGASAPAAVDAFQTGSVWTDASAGRTLTVLERAGGTFRARFVIRDVVVREINGTVTGDRISWLAKDAKDIKGPAGGDNVGTIAGDRIDFTWRGPGTDSGAFTLRLQEPESGGASPDRRAAEWVLSTGGDVHIREPERSPRQIRPGGTLPDGPFEVTRIYFYLNRKVSDEGLRNLRGLKAITSLGLAGSGPISNQGLLDAGLSEMQALDVLDISSSGVNDAILDEVAKLPRLRQLWLDGPCAPTPFLIDLHRSCGLRIADNEVKNFLSGSRVLQRTFRGDFLPDSENADRCYEPSQVCECCRSNQAGRRPCCSPIG